MGCNPRIGRYFAGRQMCLLGFLCLLALLPYFFLPLAYYVYLTPLSLPAFSEDPRAGPPVFFTRSGHSPPTPQHHFCGICRARPTCQDYTFCSALPPPDSNFPTRLAFPSDSNRQAKTFGVPASGLRAPPRFLLPLLVPSLSRLALYLKIDYCSEKFDPSIEARLADHCRAHLIKDN
jgi:hypothetical protein